MTYNFSSLIGQMQARINGDGFYSYRVKSVDDDGNILYSRHVTAIKVEEGILDNIDRDVILIVCGVMAIVLFVILLTIVYGRKIGGTLINENMFKALRSKKSSCALLN
ncbi:uncharacterized protein LOC141906209 [Tubulanus polymorphus]|uniref:uncharacterized protein LOC141906209 n=1 Tax=Tubulanus polymorphus TaxID=672921 RepID=UPI003DA4F9EF